MAEYWASTGAMWRDMLLAKTLVRLSFARTTFVEINGSAHL